MQDAMLTPGTNKKHLSSLIAIRLPGTNRRGQVLPISLPTVFPSVLSCCTFICLLSPDSERSSDYTQLQLLDICGALLEAFHDKKLFERAIRAKTCSMIRVVWLNADRHVAAPLLLEEHHSAIQRLQRLHCSQKVTRLITAEANMSIKSWRATTVKTIKPYMSQLTAFKDMHTQTHTRTQLCPWKNSKVAVIKRPVGAAKCASMCEAKPPAWCLKEYWIKSVRI